MGVQPNHKERKIDHYTLPVYIKFLGYRDDVSSILENSSFFIQVEHLGHMGDY